MHPIVYYTVSFAVAGAAGMAIAAKKAAPEMRRQRWLKFWTYIAITATVIVSIFYHLFAWLALLIVVTSMIELTRINLHHVKKRLSMVVVSFIVLLALAAGFVLFAANVSWAFALFIYFQVLVFDGFCQVTGQLWGKHQLAPSISPPKTVEGLAGGWIFCIIAAMLAANWIQVSVARAAFFGLTTGFTASCGDILASYYKRKAGVKDYSNWLPGQGGFLDRFDSLFMTASVYYLFLYLLNFGLVFNR